MRVKKLTRESLARFSSSNNLLSFNSMGKDHDHARFNFKIEENFYHDVCRHDTKADGTNKNYRSNATPCGDCRKPSLRDWKEHKSVLSCPRVQKFQLPWLKRPVCSVSVCKRSSRSACDSTDAFQACITRGASVFRARFSWDHWSCALDSCIRSMLVWWLKGEKTEQCDGAIGFLSNYQLEARSPACLSYPPSGLHGPKAKLPTTSQSRRFPHCPNKSALSDYCSAEPGPIPQNAHSYGIREQIQTRDQFTLTHLSSLVIIAISFFCLTISLLKSSILDCWSFITLRSSFTQLCFLQAKRLYQNKAFDSNRCAWGPTFNSSLATIMLQPFAHSIGFLGL